VSTPTYTVSATVSGLNGSGLVLQDNGADDRAVAANGGVTFSTALASGAAYNVSVKTQPSNPAQNCSVANGSGAVGSANVSNVTVTCVASDTDTRPLALSLGAMPHAAMGALVPYRVTEAQGITLTSTTWYFDGVAGGNLFAGFANGTLHPWNTPGAHTIRVVATASNGRSAQASISTTAVNAPIASGAAHSCALTPAGAVKCWGYGGNGNLGNNQVQNQSSPVNASGLTGVLGLAAGDGHTCALKPDLSVACWGDNTEGQLGHAPSFHSITNPTPLPAGGLANVVALAAGRYHTCALKADGTVACFGKNSEAELGSAASGSQSVTPVTVSGLGNAVAISAGGGYFTCALKADTTVACWGDNESGQLGTGQSTPSQTGTPQTVLTAQGVPLNRVLAIRSGVYHTCAIVNDGSFSVYCWGGNSYQQTATGAGNVVYAATRQASLSGALLLSASMYNSCSLEIGGGFKCWGSNDYGESIGQAGGANHVLSPTIVPALQGGSLPEYMSGGNEFTCALQADGRATCFGRGINGELGNGSSLASPTPVLVNAPAGSFWTWMGT
jgi:alpha-tubulin suppressor-like RCC1 family protein